MGTNLTYLQVVAITFFTLEFRTVKCHAALSRNFKNALVAIFQPLDLQKTCQSMEVSMGSLVLTKGTRHLIKHFQKEFRPPRLDDLRNDPIMGTATRIKDAFADSTNDLLWLTNNIKHPHSTRASDHKCLLPDDSSGGQPHLEARWIYFLSNNANVLTPTNHQTIRGLISKVLNDTSYGYIDFDCIEGPTQTVLPADEFDNSGANPVKYLRIVLVTPAMNKFSGDPGLELDPQGGYTFNLVPNDGNGGDTAKGQNSKPTQD
jgi:hypothetical protein